MATIDQLERLDREIEEAERQALRNLADHLREAVLDIPVESRLARVFVRHAKKFDMWAQGSGPGAWGVRELTALETAAAQESLLEHPVETAYRAMIAAGEVEGEPLEGFLRRMAATLPDRGQEA